MEPWAEFYAYMRGERRFKPSTIQTYAYTLARWEEYVGVRFTRDRSFVLDASHVRAFMRERSDLSFWTHNRMLSAAKCWHRFGAIEGWWEENGISNLAVKIEAGEPKPPLTPDQAGELLGMCRSPREFRLIFLSLYEGCRRAEAERIDGACWLPDRLRFVRKGGRVGEVPLHPEVAKVKERILADEHLPPQALKYVHQKMRERTSFDWTPHSLRRTFSQRLLDSDAPMWEVDALMGHAGKSMTLKSYGRLKWETLVETHREAVHYPVRISGQLVLF